MEIDMTIIGYVLYAGLGLSVLSFLMLVLAMFTKKEAEPIFDQAINDDYEDDDDSDVYEDEEVETPKRKSLFGFGKKRNTVLDDEDFEIFDEEDIYEEDDEGNEEIDEYAKDFELSFREDNSIPKRRTPYANVDLNEFDSKTDDEDDTFEEIEIKKYSTEEAETPYSRIDDGDLDEEDEMLKRIQQYRDKFKK